MPCLCRFRIYLPGSRMLERWSRICNNLAASTEIRENSAQMKAQFTRGHKGIVLLFFTSDKYNLTILKTNRYVQYITIQIAILTFFEKNGFICFISFNERIHTLELNHSNKNHCFLRTGWKLPFIDGAVEIYGVIWMKRMWNICTAVHYILNRKKVMVL